MGLFKLISFFVCLEYVLSEVSILDPCNKDDVSCLRSSTQQFLEATKQDIPQFNIKGIDPMIIPSMDFLQFRDLGLTWHYKNLNLTGMKNMNVQQFKIDSEKRDVRLETNVYLNMFGDITINLVDSGKTYSGTFTAKGPANLSFSYEYGISSKDGVEHFVVHEETIVCEVVDIPESNLSPEVLKAFKSDEFKSISNKFKTPDPELRKEVFCKIAKEAYRTFINNIRLSATYLPKNAFFKDI